MKPRATLLAALAPLAIAACEPRQLYLANRTVIGINAAVDPEQTTGHLIIGYDRAFATVIPRSVPASDASTDGRRDAMSVLACSNLAVEGITIRRYTESLATGEAAGLFAAGLVRDGKDSPAAQAAKAPVKDFFDCFKQTPPAKDATGGGP